MGSKGERLPSRGTFGANKLKTNDRLWNAMQPALQLATRMLLTNHPCIVGMQDVTNRYRVPDHLYKNRRGQDPDEVKYKIKSDQQPHDPEHVRAAQRLQSCPGFSAPAASQRALERVMDLKLQSAFYSSGGEYKDHCIARTFMHGISHREGTIKVTIDAELLWIVISDKYSKSEKMVASLVFAAALVHEMMVSTAPEDTRDAIDKATIAACSGVRCREMGAQP